MFDRPVCVQCSLRLVTPGTIYTVHQFLIGGVLADMHMSPQYPKQRIWLVHFTYNVLDQALYGAAVDPDSVVNFCLIFQFF
jgi:hypothetical protein